MRFPFKNKTIATHLADVYITNNVIISTFSESDYSGFFIFHFFTYFTGLV
ncbi:hypothetical protein ACLHG3_001968 [Serratia marcescens]